jgi:predicted extracellular nuclease
MRARRSIPALLALSLLAAAGACRDSGGDDGDDTPIDAGDGDAPNPDDMKIQVVQDDATAVGTPVTLRGVVVVAKDTYGSRTGNLFVMEPEGGAFSGVLVFGAPLEQFDAVAVGDLVDITNAEKDEFALVSDTSGRTTTELTGAGGGDMLIVKVGTGTVPAPQSVDAAAIAALPADMRDAEREKWEGVLIKVSNVSVTQDVRHISGNPDDPTFNEFSITGDYRVDSSLSEVNLTPPTVRAGDCLASVTGMGDYFFNYKILPRMIGDIVPGGTNCPVPPSTTVEAIQTGQVPVGTQVTLHNVYVTGRSFNGRHIWVADALQAAPNHGVYVFRGSSPALPANIVVGAKVNVSGQVDEFDGTDGGESVTEVSFATVTLVEAPAGPTLPVTGVTVPTLLNATTGEPYEGVLVKLENVKSTSAFDPTSGQSMMQAGTTAFIADDDMFRLTMPSGTCYRSIIGIWHYNAFPSDNRYVFLPRSMADIDTNGGTCP